MSNTRYKTIKTSSGEEITYSMTITDIDFEKDFPVEYQEMKTRHKDTWKTDVNNSTDQCVLKGDLSRLETNLMDKSISSTQYFDLESGESSNNVSNSLCADLSPEDTWEIDVDQKDTQCIRRNAGGDLESTLEAHTINSQPFQGIDLGIDEPTSLKNNIYTSDLKKNNNIEITSIDTWETNALPAAKQSAVKLVQNPAEERYGPFLGSLFSLAVEFVPCGQKKKIPMKGFSYTSMSLMKCYDLQEYINKYPNLNLGLRVGKGIVVMDFDKPGSYEVFRKQHPDLKTLVVKSGRATDGYHVYFRNDSIKNKSDMYLDGIDTKVGELMANGYIMLPGTVHDKSGQLYEVLEGSFDEILKVDDDFLLQYQKKVTEQPKPKLINKPSNYNGPMFTELDDKSTLLPNQGLTLNQKYQTMTNDRKLSVETRTEADKSDYSKADFRAIIACLYVGLTEDEVIELAHQFPNGLGTRYTIKDKKDPDFNYLRADYQRALKNFDVDKANNTARRHNNLSKARLAKASKPKESPEMVAFKSICHQIEKRNLSVMSWRQMTDSKIFKSKSTHLIILQNLVESGKLEWVMENKSVKLTGI